VGSKLGLARRPRKRLAVGRSLVAMCLAVDLVFVVLVGTGQATPGDISRLPISLGATEAALSEDGRYLAFVSEGTLVPSDTNHLPDVYRYDRATGVIRRISVASSGAQANGASSSPSISADGRYVAFLSEATNLVKIDTNGVADVFVRDVVGGTTRRSSVTNGERQANSASSGPSISADGRFVAFHSYATNLNPQGVSDGIYLRDRTAGTTIVITVNDGAFYGYYVDPRLSGNGRYVAWAEYIIGTEGDWSEGALFVTDRTTLHSTEIAHAYVDGWIDAYDLSDTGGIVAWHSTGMLGDRSVRPVAVWKRATGTTTRVPGRDVSVAGDGSRVYSSAGDVVRAFEPATTRLEVLRVASTQFRVLDSTGVGSQVLVRTDAPNLVPGDTGLTQDLFLIQAGTPPPTPTVARPADVALQPDGRFIVAGTVENTRGDTDLALFRYTAAGVLDSTFGTHGIATTNFGRNENVVALAVQPDGHIVVGADTDAGMAVLRYTAFGKLDPTFGTAGVRRIAGDYGFNVSEMGGLLVQADGAIVVSGTGSVHGYQCQINDWSGRSCSELMVIRLTPQGALDPTFNGGGILGVGADFEDNTGGSIVLQNGSYVVLGNRGVVRVLSDGRLDGTFGNGGTAQFDARALGLVGGKIVIIVPTCCSDMSAAERLTAAGTLDTSFGGGVVPLPFDPTSVGAAGGGKPYVGGTVESPLGVPRFTVMRLTSSGAFDSTFGVGGRITVSPAAGGYGRLADLLATPEGRLLLVGSAVPSPDRSMDIGAVRRTFTGSADTTFGGGDGRLNTPFIPS
jgi:uncharacterized delta-60 repeat protein